MPSASPASPAEPLAGAPPATDATAHAAFIRSGEGWTPLRYLCDGVAGDRVVAVTDAEGAGELTSFAKPALTPATRPVRLGEVEAGAGSVWRTLTSPGGDSVGAVRSINPGMLGDADAVTLPTVSSLRLGSAESRCRWLPRARALLVTQARSAIVTADANGSYTYRSFDHDKPGRVTEGGEAGTSSTPTAEVRGGSLESVTDGRETYVFTAAPWTYRVTASASAAAPGASITVLRDGREVSRAPAIAYEMAAARQR